jgi:hypothetical protein
MRSEGRRFRVGDVEVVALGRSRSARSAGEPAKLLGSLCEAIVPEPATPARVARVAGFVHEQHAALPLALRALLAIGLTGFRTLVALRFARGFCALDLATRRRVVRAWSYGWFPPGRQLFRVVRGPALLAWYDLPEEPRA